MNYNIYDLIGLSKLPKLIIVEGFDFVGKTYFIDNLLEYNKNLVAWKPKYDSELNNLVLPYSDRYSLNIALIDLIENNITKNKTIIVDRGLLSGFVYNILYNQGISSMKNLDFNNYVRKKYCNKKLVHNIYIEHTDKNKAYMLYNYSLNRDYNESYDKFESFEKYIQIYHKFDELYKKCLNDFCGTNYTRLSSWSFKSLT